MNNVKLTLNIRQPPATGEAVKSAAKRKAASIETLEDAWARVLAMNLTDKERRQVELGREAFENGDVGRTRDGKFTKGEAIEIGKRVEAEADDRLRESRIRETLANKPDGYFILTDDSELPKFIERIREEVRLQRDQWRDRFEMLGVDSMTAGDFEGTGIDAYIDLSIGFSIWLPLLGEGYYLAYGHVDGFDVPYAFQAGDKQLTRSKVLEAISPYLSQPTQGKTFHMGSARYDLHIALNDGYRIQGCVWDTLDAMRLMNEHEDYFGLKPLIQKYGKHFGIDGDVYSFDDLFGNRSPAPFNTEIVGIYAINDVKYGWALFEWQFEIMRKTDRLLECYAYVDKDLPETDVYLERCGFRLDFELLRSLEDEFHPKIDEATRQVFETYRIDADFIRKMDRTINANKIKRWQETQQKRIDSLQERLTRKQEIVAKLEAEGKTHLKRYENEVDFVKQYTNDMKTLVAPAVENSPQEITEFSITNGNHIGYLIYDHLGIRDRTYVVDRMKKRSTAAAVLEMYYEDEPALAPLAKVAEYTKLLSTFISPYLEAEGRESTIEVDGRLHSNFKAGGTATGRYSSSSYSGRSKVIYVKDVADENFIPTVKALIKDDSRVKRGVNLQNIPSRSANGRRVRNAYIPNDGWIFVGSDLGQIEPRIQAHIMYSVYGDNSMRKIFVDGVDLYTSMAVRIFGFDEKYCVDKALDPTGTFSPRDATKTGILAKSYGQSADAFARNFGIPLKLAEDFFVSFDEEFPSFTKMVEDTMVGLRKNGFVETLYGRKRRFPDYKRTRAEVQRNERKLMGYYIERKQLNGKKEKSARDTARLAKLAELIAPLADKRNLVSYWERAAFNARIQGTGADILKRIGNRLARECIRNDWEFNASIHDEVKFSLPLEELTEETIELVRVIMTETTELTVPLVTDTVIETRWMEAYKPSEWFGSKDE